MVVEGRLRMEWVYSAAVHREETIRRVAEGDVEALRGVIEHCRTPQAGGFTPSDVEEFNWSQSDLDSIAAAIEGSLERMEGA